MTYRRRYNHHSFRQRRRRTYGMIANITLEAGTRLALAATTHIRSPLARGVLVVAAATASYAGGEIVEQRLRANCAPCGALLDAARSALEIADPLLGSGDVADPIARIASQERSHSVRRA